MKMEDLFDVNKSMLKSSLLDEGKLITYHSISRDLCVHVNVSKVIAKRLVEQVRHESPELPLNVSYIICGVTGNNSARIIVCSEPELNKEKQCFKTIFFEHIYSVMKGKPGVDTAAYLCVNNLEDLPLCIGSIKSRQCDKRTIDEIGNLKSNSQEVFVPEKSKSLPFSSKAKQETNSSKNGKIQIRSPLKNVESELLIKQELISPKKIVVDNMKPKVSSINGHKTQQKGIAGFFNKTNNHVNKKDVKEKLQNVKETEKNSSECEKMEVEEILPIVAEVKEEVKKESTNKILKNIKKTSKVDKKRKRVLHVSDSESDHENNDPFLHECDDEKVQENHESEDEIPPTPTVTNVVIRSGIVNPKKKRKVVDKTYTDEDGYILTKKVEVYESCSENEEEIKVQEKSSKAKEVKIEISSVGKTGYSKKKVSPPQKGKQPTLTNFFKKV